MEEDNKIDDLFYGRLGAGESSPPAASWDAIQNKLASNRANERSRILPIPFLWLSSAFLSGIVLGSVLLYFGQVTNKREEVDRIAYLEAEMSKKELANKQLTDRLNDVLYKKENSSGRPAESLVSTGRMANLYTFSPQERHQDRVVLFTSQKNTTRPNSTNNSGQLGRYASNEVSDRSGKQVEKGTEVSYGTESEPVGGMLSFDNQSNKTSGSVNNSNSENVRVEISELLSKSKSDVLDQLAKVDTMESAPLDSTKKTPQKGEDMKLAKKVPKIFGLPIAIGFYLSPEMASRSVHFTSKATDDVVAYKHNDQAKMGFSTGLLLELSLPKNYFVRAGISYWNVGERNTSEYQAKSIDTTWKNNTLADIVKFDSISLSTTSIDLDGKISLPQINQSITQFTSTVQNNYHYIGLPIVVGMRLGRSRLSAGLFSGVIMNLLVSSNKAVYSIYHDPSQPEKFKQSYRELSRVSFVYWGGLDIDYRLSPNWSLSLSPNIKYSLSSLYKNEPSVRQLPYSIGLMLGVKYIFATR